MFRTALLAFALTVTTTFSVASAQSDSEFDATIQEARASMMRDPGSALEAAQNAAALARNLPQADAQMLMAQAEWLQAEATTRLGRPAEAAEIAERAIRRLGAEPEPTKLLADLKVARGRIAMATGDFEVAFISFTEAYAVFQAIEDSRSQAIVLQSIGSIYTAAGQYERALTYFTDARERHSDPSLDLAALNNTANAYRELGDYQQSLSQYQQALAIAEQLGSPVLEARILNNIAALHVQFEAYDAGDAAITDAFDRVSEAGSGEWLRFLYGVRAQIAVGRADFTTARTQLERTFEGVPLGTTPQNFTEFHETGIEIYSALGEWRLALDHARAFKRLEDEARDVSASANSALLGAEFDFAEQELQIQQLRSDRLEQDLALASSRTRTVYLTAAVGAALLLCILIAVAAGYRTERTRKKALAAALYFDPECDLPSRRSLEETLTAKTDAGFEYFIFAVDLDRREHLRTALGFSAFAKLTKIIASRLAAGREKAEVGLIAPGVLGVLVDADTLDTGIDDEARTMATALLAHYQAPVVIDGVTIDLSAVVGVSRHVPGQQESDITIKQAVIATEQARAASADYAEFDASLYGDPEQNLALMSRINNAMESGDIVLHYQPKLDLRTGRFVSAEALMRWTDSDRGYVPPDAYIPFAEETGRIKELTYWSIKKAVIDQFAMAKAGFRLKVAVNISSALLVDSEFASEAIQIASQSKAGLIFEVTETAIMADVDKALRTLDRWSKAGIELSIDDYGTGHSSLAYLKRIPADELKLDRAFIMDVTKSQRDRMLVKATVDLAHNLDMSLTAEGVEDEETLAALQLMGCDTAQGYGICKPCGVMELIGFMQREGDARSDQFASAGRKQG